MRFGTFHLMERTFDVSEQKVYDDNIEQIVWADELGYDRVWLTEHHFSSVPYVPNVPGEYCVSASPFAMACGIARLTKNVRIGSAVKVLPLEHPLRTAEDVAMADLLSKGRIEFGVGLGYRQYEFHGLRVPIEEKLSRFQEALKIIIGVWSEEEFSYKGKHWEIPRLTLVPKPVQKPYPPVWIATRLGTAEQINFAVENGYNLLCAWAARHELRATHDLMASTRQKRGETAPFEFTCLRHIYVGQTDKEAAADAGRYIEYYMNSTSLFRPIGAHERDEMIFGGPETVVRKLRSLNEATGVNNLICWMNFGGMPQDMVKRSMTLFAKEVMPKLRH